MAVVDDVGLLCLAVDSGENNQIIGRTKLQKIVYFCQYLGWDINDYQLHYYGPFSFGLTDIIKTAEDGGLVTQTDGPPYTFNLTGEGTEFLETFESSVCDAAKVRATRNLVSYLSTWSKEELELAATIDFVKTSVSRIGRDDLLAKVGTIKDNFRPATIAAAYDRWIELKRRL